MANRTGFDKALETVRTKLDVKENVTIDAMKEAANYFKNKAESRIPKSKRNDKHLKDAMKVVVDGEEVKVVFEDKYYWYMVDKGHKRRNGKGRVRGVNFVKKTLNREKNKMSEIMLKKVKK